MGCAAAPQGHGPRPQIEIPDVEEALIPEMERVFSETRGMVQHTQRVLSYALDIQGVEGGDLAVVKASAILHDIGIPRAREIHGSSSGRRKRLWPLL